MQTASRCGYPVISSRVSADFGGGGAEIIIARRYELTLFGRPYRFAKGFVASRYERSKRNTILKYIQLRDLNLRGWKIYFPRIFKSNTNSNNDRKTYNVCFPQAGL